MYKTAVNMLVNGIITHYTVVLYINYNNNAKLIIKYMND